MGIIMITADKGEIKFWKGHKGSELKINERRKVMPNDYEVTTRSELHRTQAKFNGHLQRLELELSGAEKKIAELEGYQKMIKMFFRLAGGAIILFDIVKDSLSEKLTLRYEAGFNWQQWIILIIGFGLLFVGMYKKGKGK